VPIDAPVMTISTRRFSMRPCSVALDTTGREFPRLSAEIRADGRLRIRMREIMFGEMVMLVLVAVAMSMAQAPAPQKTAPAGLVIKCKNTDAKPCTFRQVQGLSDAVFAGKNQHDVLLPVKELAMASSAEGTLRCVQNDGSVCSTAELDVIKQIAAGLELFVNYNSAAGKTGK